MKERAEELNIKGVAMVAASAGDRVQSWSSQMLVVGSMKKGPSPDEPEMNLLAIVYSKAAEMADTLQASGSGVRPPLKGEYGWGGGVYRQREIRVLVCRLQRRQLRGRRQSCKRWSRGSESLAL